MQRCELVCPARRTVLRRHRPGQDARDRAGALDRGRAAAAALVVLLLPGCGGGPTDLATARASTVRTTAAATAAAPTTDLPTTGGASATAAGTAPAPSPSRSAAAPPPASPSASPAPASAGPSPSARPGVGWSPQPVSTGQPDPTLRKAAGGLRRCDADDLRVRTALDVDAPEPARRTLVLAATAVGSSDCGLDDHGFGLRLPGSEVQAAGATTADARPDDLVRPGDRLVLLGHLSNWCRPERAPLRVALDDGTGRVVAVEGTVTPPGCDAARYGSREPQGGVGITAVSRAGSPLLLVPLLEAPPTARAGGTLAYDLRLTNVSDRPVRLDGCPVFTHALGRLGQQPDPGRTTEAHRLPCSGLPGQVGPGGSLDVTGVQLAVPGGRGRSTLGWSWGPPATARFGEQWDGVRGRPVDVR